MIKVTLGNNLNRKKVMVSPNKTIREVLEENEINYISANMHLDGCALQPGDFDKTFNELGITEQCFLLQVIKADNA